MKHRIVRRFLALLLAVGSAVAVAAFPASEPRGATRAVRNFDKVELNMGGDLVLVLGTTESLEIVASEEDLERISTVVGMGTLRIGQVRPGDSPRGPITYTLTMKSVSGLATNSSGNIVAGSIDANALALTVRSSGSITVGRLSARTLAVEIASSGHVDVAGTVERQTLTSSSSGEYRAEDLDSREASLNLSSSGRAAVRVTEQLVATISSSGDVLYRGNPAKITVNASSSGKLIRRD